MPEKSLVIYGLLAEFIFLGFAGFIAGWLTVQDGKPDASSKVKFISGLLFAGITVTFAYFIPQIILVVHNLKAFAILLLIAVYTWYMAKYKRQQKKRTKYALKDWIIELLIATVVVVSLFVISIAAAYLISRML